MKPSCDSYRSLVIVGNAKACQNKPLDDEAKCRIYNYLEEPSASVWSDISGIIVNSHMLTLWQAVRKVDPSFPATGRRYELETGRVVKEWERIPHPDLVLEAIERAHDEPRSSAV